MLETNCRYREQQLEQREIREQLHWPVLEKYYQYWEQQRVQREDREQRRWLVLEESRLQGQRPEHRDQRSLECRQDLSEQGRRLEDQRRSWQVGVSA